MARARSKSEPFSIRLTLATDRFVTSEARRTRRAKGAIVEALTEEAARMRRFPGVAFRGDDAGRRPWVIGAGLDVWEIIQMLDDYGSSDALIGGTRLDRRQLALAEAYYENYPDEIDEAIAENRRPLGELRELYPFVALTQLVRD